MARAGHPSKTTKGGKWYTAGISMLLPVYEDIEDGAEILWTGRGLMRMGAIRKLAKTKRQLPVFDDRPTELDKEFQ
jgi:hypothetical protein